MHPGQMVFTRMERVVFGQPAAEAIVAEADRRGARRVFLLASRTLAQQTDEVQQISDVLGDRFAGVHDHMPAHSPRSAVVGCANVAREAGTDLLVSVGGGSATDGAKAVTICLQHGITDEDGFEPFRTVVKDGKRNIPDFAAPDVRQIAVPTTLSAGEFNARAGITDTRVGLKQSFMHPNIIPAAVILDARITVHTPEWLWLSTGIRAVDHAVETLCSIDANDYTDGAAMHALRLLSAGLRGVKADAGDLEARHQCLMGAWMSMVGIVTGTRLGASHAIGHILGGTAGVPHGYTSCVMLPFVLEFNADTNPARQALVSEALGHAGRSAAEVLHELIDGLGLPRSLAAVGVDAGQIPQLAKNCMLDDWTYSNPKQIREPETVARILEHAL